ncbi:hypothetical protein F5X98DRAFT_386154 [Xylaria grammica]|nr:hypothetical protein F5X98DRAFT_386154 [Xylaria grammica]
MPSDAARHQGGEAAPATVPGRLRLPGGARRFHLGLCSNRATPIPGFKAFVDADTVLLDDGSTIQVDAVVVCTGYSLNFSIMPELEMDGCCGLPLRTGADKHKAKAKPEQATSKADATREEPALPRLYQMLFPPR